MPHLGYGGQGDIVPGSYVERRSRATRGVENQGCHAGMGVPGAGMFRASCDYATGSAGVLVVLDRLLKLGPADFMLDRVKGKAYCTAVES